MASASTILGDWASLDPERETLYAHTPALLLRWLNEAQLRFCNKSEILQGVWQPTVPDTGIVALPEDFLREYVDRIQWTTNQYLRKGDLPTLKLLNLSSTMYYAIYGENFYVMSPAAGSPTIHYIKKPVLITTGNATPVADPERSVRAGEVAVTTGDNLILFEVDGVYTPIIGTYVLWLELYDVNGDIIGVTPTPIKTANGFALNLAQDGTLKYTATPTT
jgi:hypothetical protein